MSVTDIPLVSVAIVTYNQKVFLIEAIESALQQDYPNIEIVVADDGSKDGTHKVLMEYKEKFGDKIVLQISKNNSGITANCNKAHFACSGKYIAWVGGDDLMLPGKISKQVELLENNPDCNIVYHNLEVFDSATGRTMYLFNNRSNGISGDVRAVIKYGTFNGACSTMVRRSSAPVNGFDEDLPVASDWMYWIQCLTDGGRIMYIDEILGRYRRHTDNVTSKHSPLQKQAFMDHVRTCHKLKLLAPQYESEIHYRLSELYRTGRHLDYKRNLLASIKLNPSNYMSYMFLTIHLLSFGKLKY